MHENIKKYSLKKRIMRSLTSGKIDVAKLRPLLFDMASVKYWRLGRPPGIGGTLENH
jgi:hypothetical protein